MRRPRGGLSIACAVAVTLVAGCTQIDGGAVEFSWALRDFAGDSISCSQAGIETVTLCWQRVDDPGDFECQPEMSRQFLCAVEQGSTAFEVPTGPTALWIEVTCEGQFQTADPTTYDVPSAIVRTVRDGEIVTLNSLLIVATEASDCGNRTCTCPP